MALVMDNAWAVVVGIAAYSLVPSLPPSVVNDARAVHEAIVDPLIGAFKREQTTLLLDGQATKETLLATLGEVARKAGPDSTVVLYLSCHGGRLTQGPEAGEYLLPVDADPDALGATAISGVALAEILGAIRSRKLLVLFDCCHAAGVGQVKAAQRQTLVAGLPESYYEALLAGRGRAILASSRSTEYSWVLPGSQNSLFTTHLLAGLRGGIQSPDGLVRVFDLFEYLQPKVTADQPQQHPVFKAEVEENFPVALAVGGQAPAPSNGDDEFRHDAYISYVDRDPDTTWVWDVLVPKLEAADLRVAVSGDVEAPGVARVVNVERGMRAAKRTIVVLSERYLADHMADFENVLAQTMGIEEGRYRLLPVKIDDLDERLLPTRLSLLTTLDLSHPRRGERNLERLVQALHGPLPGRQPAAR